DAISCPKCGHPFQAAVNPAAMRMVVLGGINYRSKATLFGLPLVHIATGFDPQTGSKRIARGIIAIGDIAMGVFSMGGLSIGGIAVGGAAIGLFSLGGLAIGALMAVGGAAVGYVAIGGGALGYYAFGGGAFGAHAVSAMSQDPQAIDFLKKTL